MDETEWRKKQNNLLIGLQLIRHFNRIIYKEMANEERRLSI